MEESLRLSEQKSTDWYSGNGLLLDLGDGYMDLLSLVRSHWAVPNTCILFSVSIILWLKFYIKKLHPLEGQFWKHCSSLIYSKWLPWAKNLLLYDIYPSNPAQPSRTTQKTESWKEHKIFEGGSHPPVKKSFDVSPILVTLGNMSNIPCDSRSHFQAFGGKALYEIKQQSGDWAGERKGFLFSLESWARLFFFTVLMGILLDRIICLLHSNCFVQVFLLSP